MSFEAFPNLQFLGKLKPRKSREIASSRLGVGFETLDRSMWDPNQAWPVLDELGVKWARVQTGWARTETVAGVYWQGEAGVQSYVPEAARGVGALSTMKFSEAIQARMLLRRSLLELHNGAAMTSYFHMADFAHYATFKQTFHYGLVRLEDGSPKPAYRALQTLCTLLCDPMEPALGRSAAHMSVLEDSMDPRATKALTWHANFVRGDVPVHAWWVPESLENDPVVKAAELTYWLDRRLRLDNPVLIDPVSQDVYAVPVDRDRRTCAETWMQPDAQAEGVLHFKPLPVSTDPLLLTDRSIVDLR